MEIHGPHSERMVPEEMHETKMKYLLYLRHLKAYDFAIDYVKKKKVLEIGCGTGYGAEYLCDFAKRYIGTDIAGEAIKFCKKNHKK